VPGATADPGSGQTRNGKVPRDFGLHHPLHPWLIIISTWFNSKFDGFTIWFLTCFNHVEKYESQWEELSHVLYEIKNPNHQPAMV
jgi:hypothetical protein